jgi:hypothetical protein
MEELFSKLKTEIRTKRKRKQKGKNKREKPGAHLGRTQEASQPRLPRADPTHSFPPLSL